MRGRATSLLGGLADLIWPRACAVETCAQPSDRPGRHLCSACFAGLPFLAADSVCSVCGAPIAAKVDHAFRCETCTKRPPPFAFARAAARFEEPCRQLILDFKFHRATWLAADFTDLLEGLVRSWPEMSAIDCLVPVPLHEDRLRERGYNQSELLAEALARRINRRADCRSLVRTRATGHQTRLSEEERRANLVEAFAVPDPRRLRGRTVLLIDDVMTTGTTLEACARALREAGAFRVWCATVARAVRS